MASISLDYVKKKKRQLRIGIQLKDLSLSFETTSLSPDQKISLPDLCII